MRFSIIKRQNPNFIFPKQARMETNELSIQLRVRKRTKQTQAEGMS
jgi:hypothetical protein